MKLVEVELDVLLQKRHGNKQPINDRNKNCPPLQSACIHDVYNQHIQCKSGLIVAAVYDDGYR